MPLPSAPMTIARSRSKSASAIGTVPSPSVGAGDPDAGLFEGPDRLGDVRDPGDRQMGGRAGRGLTDGRVDPRRTPLRQDQRVGAAASVVRMIAPTLCGSVTWSSSTNSAGPARGASSTS